MKTIFKVIRFAFAILLSVNAIQDTSNDSTRYAQASILTKVYL